MAQLSRINWTKLKHFWRRFEKIWKVHRKIQNLNTLALLQLTPLVGCLEMAGKILSTRENFP
jgi:hypothetical protein